MINKQFGAMRPHTRQMIRTIADDRMGLFPLLFMIYQMPNCDAIFQRMIENKIIGEKLGQALGDCNHDLPSLLRKIMV